MVVCANCKKEMKCVQTGTNVRYGYDHSHCYAGDMFECPDCGNKIVKCNESPYYNDEVQLGDILMN